MNLIKVIILGIIQGITDFLPISSSGHLDIFLHFGTVVPILIIFWDDVLDIFAFRNKRLSWLIITEMIPTGLMSIFLEDFFTGLFSSVRIVGFMLLVTGLILYFAEKAANAGYNLKSMKWYHGIVVGIAQGMAIIPGISRSGSTISAALIQGLDRESAARYSFLLSAPVIMGAGVLEVKDIVSIGIADLSWLLITTGTIAAAVSGYFAIKYLLKILQKGKLSIFSYYCWTLGVLVIILSGILN